MKTRLNPIRKALLVAGGLLALGGLFLSRSQISANQTPGAGSLFSAPSGWTESDSYTGVRTWAGEKERREYLSVIEDDSMKAEVPNPDDKKFIETVKSASALPNWIAQITEWKVEKLERVKLPEGQKLILVGTYLNSKNELIRFEEWKYFLKDGYGQINYSEVANPNSRDRAQVAEILKRYHPFGI